MAAHLISDSTAAPPKVMVSFSSRDADWVDILEADLAELGILLVRYEKSIRSQESIVEFISTFSECDFAFIFLSSTYFESDICMIELAVLSESPDKAVLVSVPPDGDDAPNLASTAVDRVVSYGSTPSILCGWVKEELGRIDWGCAEERIRSLLSKRCMQAGVLGDYAGRRGYLSYMGYTPGGFAARLDAIVSMDDLADREAAFDAYLETGFRGDAYLYAKALSYEKAGYCDLALNYLGEALRMTPGYIAAFVCACRIAVSARGQVQRDAFGIIESFDVDAAMLEDGDRADALHALGLLALSNYERTRNVGQLREAHRLLDQSLAICERSTAFNAQGQVLERLDNSGEAREMYVRAIALDEKNYAAHNNLGLIMLRHEHDTEGAKREFARALDLCPTYELALNGYALASESDDLDGAFLAYIRLACRGYESSHALSNAALIAEEDFEEPRAARALYVLALDRNPEGMATNYNYATFLRRTGEAASRVEAHLDIARRAGDSMLVEIGFVLLKMRDGHFEDAVRLLSSLGEPGKAAGRQLLGFLELYAGMRCEAMDGSTCEYDPAGDVDFWPYGDLAARLLLGIDDDRAAEYRAAAMRCASGSDMPEPASAESTDFSAHFHYVERMMPVLLNERVKRAQVVSVSDDAKSRMAEAITRAIGDAVGEG